MRLFKLPDTVYSIKGNASAFLNGIASNVPESLHNAFLNQHGRIIATFRQHKVSDDEFLISVPTVAREGLLKHLERYVKLSHVRIAPSELSTFMDLDTAETVWSAAAQGSSVSNDEFTLFRLKHGIPLMGIDYQAGEFILNVHEYDHVSYTKGCFLGQEPVAKVHNRAKPSRKLTVIFEDQCPVEDAAKMTSLAFDPASGRKMGFIFLNNRTS
jgi:folate-binding protein YgfZ